MSRRSTWCVRRRMGTPCLSRPRPARSGAPAANLGFDFSKDLTPIAAIASVPFVLTVYPGLGVKTVHDFVALAKAKPDALTFGGTAAGTSGYLAAQLFNQHAGTNLAIASYPSTAQATTDLMTGRISIAFASAANVLQLIEDGKLTALAVAQAKPRCHDPSGAVDRRGRIARCLREPMDRDAGAGGHTERHCRYPVEGNQ